MSCDKFLNFVVRSKNYKCGLQFDLWPLEQRPWNIPLYFPFPIVALNICNIALPNKSQSLNEFGIIYTGIVFGNMHLIGIGLSIPSSIKRDFPRPFTVRPGWETPERPLKIGKIVVENGS